MGTPNLSKLDSPLGPLRDKFTETIGAADYELESGFICQAATAGSLIYRTLEGSADQTETVAVGAVIGVGNVPVVLRAVRGTSSVTSIVVGRL